jgi:hypothetical protein
MTSPKIENLKDNQSHLVLRVVCSNSLTLHPGPYLLSQALTETEIVAKTNITLGSKAKEQPEAPSLLRPRKQTITFSVSLIVSQNARYWSCLLESTSHYY